MTLSHAHNHPRKPERVVALGSGGFLGRGLIKACAAAGIEAAALGSRDIDLAEASAGARLAERLRPKDALVFLAALTPDKGRDSGTLMRNLAMGRAVCEATRAVAIAQLVYASSDAVYSFATALISEETPAVPVDLYGVMHRTRELMLAAEANAQATPTIPTVRTGSCARRSRAGALRCSAMARKRATICMRLMR
jgi:UDP-glucose 4-epimerase